MQHVVSGYIFLWVIFNYFGTIICASALQYNICSSLYNLLCLLRLYQRVYFSYQ